MTTIFDYERWGSSAVDLARTYGDADPFPHVVLDDFLVGTAADAMLAEFPGVTDGEWIHYHHVNERKLGRRDRHAFDATLAAAIDELTGPRFVAFLEELTGIRGLVADSALEGGGIHQSERGGFLNVHADFTVHPHKPTWGRRVNLLLYLSNGWQDEWGGHLELWDRAMTRPVRRLAPLHNRVVIFTTDETSFHGHPTPLSCPDGETRKSLALYYFTREPGPVRIRSTEYRPRPDDGIWGVLIRADTLALRSYDWLKRRFGFDDRWVSRVLRGVRRRR